MPQTLLRAFAVSGRGFAAVLSLALLVSAAAPPAAHAAPSPWRRIDAIVQAAIKANQLPGAVVLIGHDGRIVYRRAFGYRALEPRKEKMTLGTIFDCASLTKVVATTPSIMQLFERGQLRLNDPVSQYLPAFAVNGKADITIRELLTHDSGLPPDLDTSHPWHSYAEGVRRAEEIVPAWPAGAHFAYSDVNFLVLGELVRVLSGERLDQYALEHVWRPLGMSHTRFLPPKSWRWRIAPTERDPETGQWLRGVVHDPTARYMEGVSGDAGMFSDAADLAKYAQMLLNGGRGANGARILNPLTVRKMTTPQTPFNLPAVRGLGWDIDSPFSSNRGELLPVGSYGHTGFTGTSLWIDPYSDSYIIILSNAIHPDGRPPISSLRSKVATAVAAILYPPGPPAHPSVAAERHYRDVERALERITGYSEVAVARHRVLYRNGQVLTGLDVLKAENFAPLRGRKVGLITNPSGIDRDGNRNIDDMIAAGIHVTAAFSPEHGWSGRLDTTAIGDTRDHATGVPVFSAYGAGAESRHLPAAGLALVDTLVYDIQDAGVRFYTFETTLGYTLQAAAERHLPVFVLDRPDPINGISVQGPILSSSETSFVGFYPGMPVRNGMTVGELAEMFNQTLHIGADLTVVKMQGWSRGDYFDETGLPWVDPSPNLRNLEESILYPGVAEIEGTNVSVGRGTDTPFEWIGAPWIDGSQLAAYLNARRIPGVRFIPVRFTPASSRYAGQLCQGVNIELVQRNLLDAPELGIELASALAKFYPNQWQSDEMHILAGSQAVVDAIRSGEDPRRIAAQWQAGDDAFGAVRDRYLLY